MLIRSNAWVSLDDIEIITTAARHVKWPLNHIQTMFSGKSVVAKYLPKYQEAIVNIDGAEFIVTDEYEDIVVETPDKTVIISQEDLEVILQHIATFVALFEKTATIKKDGEKTLFKTTTYKVTVEEQKRDTRSYTIVTIEGEPRERLAILKYLEQRRR